MLRVTFGRGRLLANAFAMLALSFARGTKMLRSFNVRIDESMDGGFVAEKWGTNEIVTTANSITVTGNNRLYGVAGFQAQDWDAVTYRRLPLLNRELAFTVDLSGVGCGCNGERAAHVIDYIDENCHTSLGSLSEAACVRCTSKPRSFCLIVLCCTDPKCAHSNCIHRISLRSCDIHGGYAKRMGRNGL